MRLIQEHRAGLFSGGAALAGDRLTLGLALLAAVLAIDLVGWLSVLPG